MKKQLVSTSFFLILILSFSNCARNPVTGKKQVVLMSEAQEIAMGKEADPQIVAQYGSYEDSALQNFINVFVFLYWQCVQYRLLYILF